MATTRRGAPAAYRGYRLQALYTLSRLLDASAPADLILLPEGKEDLDTLHGDQLIEVAQVKSYEGLALSDLDLKEAYSFFQRVIRLASESQTLRILLVNFGPIGPQMQKAWTADSPQRRTIASKLKSFGLSDEEVATVLDRVELVSLDENAVRERVFALLQDALVGIDTENAFDLLTFWLYLKAEQRAPITRSEAIERITSVGKFLAERHAYLQEWFTSIVPLEDQTIEEVQRESLRAEFFAGIAARYEHILANLDFLRPRWLQVIEESFAQHNVVIVHSASGQGKSTLAFRYLREYYPSTWCFRIELIRDRQHVLSITRALAGFAAAVQAPMAIYIDVSPRDTDWPELVQRLAPNPLFRVLITIREEDLRRSALPGAIFSYADVSLSFNRDDASEIYERAVTILPERRFLDFTEAWDAFGEQGPLLEFVYLLTQTTTLRERLFAQIAFVRDEIRAGRRPVEEIRLLHMVAVASAYEARIDVVELAEKVALPDLAWSLEQFEREYLVRVSNDRRFVEGLHPVRSRLIVDILTDAVLSPWGRVATEVLPVLCEEDLESFLLYALVERPAEEPALLSFAQTHAWQSWTGFASIGRVLLWAAIRTYVNTNRPTIRDAHEAFGAAWWIVLNFDMVGVAGDVHKEWVETFKQFIPEQRQQQIASLQARQTSKSELFTHIKAWLTERQAPSNPPTTTSDWMAVVQIWSWLEWLDAPKMAALDLSDAELDAAVHSLALEILADLSIALYQRNRDRHQRWFDQHVQLFHERLANEYQIVALEERDETLKTHYILDTQSVPPSSPDGTAVDGKTNDGSTLHDETMERLRLVRRLVPMYGAYGAQAYGHTFGDLLPLPVDDTRKEGVQANALNPTWQVSPNTIAYGLAWYEFRPDSWQEFAFFVLNLRRSVVTSLEQLANAIKKFAQQGNRQGKTRVFQETIDFDALSKSQAMLTSRTLLPKIAVDPWGFGGESQNDQILQSSQYTVFLTQAIATKKYNPYFKAEQSYTSSLSAFFKHAIDVMVTNAATAHLSKATPPYERVIAYLKEHGQKTNLAHLSTYVLSQGRSALGAYQNHFRSLFGALVEVDELTAIERREQDILNILWPLWYFFAHQPQQRWASPHSQILGQLQSAQRQFIERLRHACTLISIEGVQITLHKGVGSWGSDSVAWIQLDLDDPTDLYSFLELLVQSLRTSLGIVTYEELLSYVIEERGSYIAIVPSFRGKSLNRSAWRLHTRMTVMSADDLSQREMRWKFIQQPVPDENWSILSIALWQHPDVELMDRLATAVGGLYMLIARLSVLLNLPNVTMPGGEMIKAFIASQAALGSEQLQNFYDAVVALGERFLKLSPEEATLRSEWSEVAGKLSELNELIKPPESDSSERGFTISEIPNYLPRLEQGAVLVEAMKLQWLRGIILSEERHDEL